MKYFLEYVISALVDYKDEVDVQERDDGKTIVYEVRVNPSDVGKVIGKNGRTIGAIRSLMIAANSKNNKRVSLEVLDEDLSQKNP